MNRRPILLIGVTAMLALVLTACAGTDSSPTTAPAVPASAARSNPPTTNPTPANSAIEAQLQTVEGGSVAVMVTPIALKQGQPFAFGIAMDTHSVELKDDLLKVVVLRDDTGKEYTPTTWDGPGAGGHHREGTLKFAALAANVKSVTLVVKNVAGVPERLFTWDVPQ